MKITKNDFLKESLQDFDKTGNFRTDSDSGRKKILFLSYVFILVIFINISASSQTLTSIYASSGSLAPWGFNQGLLVDASGNTKVYRENVETGAVDSVSMVLSAVQMQAIVDTAVVAGFFSLGPLYDSGAFDGSGITLNIVTSSAANTSEVRNKCVTAMNRVVRTINLKIISTGIQLNYGYLNAVCP